MNADGTMLYVCDFSNHRIRQVNTSTGAVTTLAGGSSGTAGAYLDGNGTGAGCSTPLCARMRWTDRVQSYAHAGAGFNSPRGLAIGADGSLYVGDQGNNRIRKVTAAGVVTTLAGSGTATFADGVGAAAAFNLVLGVALDPTGALLYIADYNYFRDGRHVCQSAHRRHGCVSSDRFASHALVQQARAECVFRAAVIDVPSLSVLLQMRRATCG
jgi:sugar lactone lactonase YvrE